MSIQGPDSSTVICPARLGISPCLRSGQMYYLFLGEEDEQRDRVCCACVDSVFPPLQYLSISVGTQTRSHPAESPREDVLPTLLRSPSQTLLAEFGVALI